MTGRIYLVRDDDSLTPLEERPYDTEDLLQTLLERYPDLLAGEQMDETSPRRWLLIAREMGIPDQEGGGGRWALDHLFLDQDGVPTLVEVKRSSDARIRREVVGQMMDYAANAVAYWPVENLRSRFEGSRGSDGQDAVADLAEHLGVADDHDELEDLVENFWSRVKTNLQAGKIRMVFVADEIPSELRRIVEFMNEQMDPAEVLAIEVKQYVGEATRTLVPKLVGQTAAAQQRKAVRPTAKQWDENRFFTRLEEEAGAEAVRVARDIHGWIRPLVTRIWFGRGAEMGSLVPTLDIAGGREKGGSKFRFFAIWTYGTVEIYFQHLKTKPPFDEEANRRELLRRLNEIDGIQLSDDVIDKRPAIPLTTLASPAALVKFKDTIQWGLAMVRQHS